MLFKAKYYNIIVLNNISLAGFVCYWQGFGVCDHNF